MTHQSYDSSIINFMSLKPKVAGRLRIVHSHYEKTMQFGIPSYFAPPEPVLKNELTQIGNSIV